MISVELQIHIIVGHLWERNVGSVEEEQVINSAVQHVKFYGLQTEAWKHKAPWQAHSHAPCPSQTVVDVVRERVHCAHGG